MAKRKTRKVHAKRTSRRMPSRATVIIAILAAVIVVAFISQTIGMIVINPIMSKCAPKAPPNLAAGTITNNAMRISWNGPQYDAINSTGGNCNERIKCEWQGRECNLVETRYSTSDISDFTWDSGTKAGCNPDIEEGGADYGEWNIDCGCDPGQSNVDGTKGAKTVTGLSPKTTYYIAVRANWTCSVAEGEQTIVQSWTSTTSARTKGVPDAPTGVSLTPKIGKINVDWSAPADTGGIAISSYKVYGGTSSPLPLIASVSASTRYYNQTGLSTGTTYYYQISAVNQYGDSTKTQSASATTPSAPSAPVISSITPGIGTVGLVWSAQNGGSDITSYSIYRSQTSGNQGLTPAASTPSTSFTDTGLTNGATYYYRVSATNGVGTSDKSAEASTTLPDVPSAPSITTVTASNLKVDLTWGVPESHGSAITGYKVYRATAPNEQVTMPTATPASASYSDANVVNGVTYYYKVSAMNGVGESEKSSESSATPQSPPPTATVPGIPTSFSATAGDAHVALSWAAPSNGGVTITAYRIYTGTSSGSLSYLTSVSGTSYDSTGLINGVVYYFQVSAVNGVGEGTKASEVSASPSAATTTTTPECPYACCNAGTYQAKACASDKICKNNACVVPTASDACPYECCLAGTYKVKVCETGKTCVNNKCSVPTVKTAGVTAAEAQVAISDAQLAITQAESTNKDASEASALLSEAQDGFAGKDYADAKAKAVAAKTTAEEAATITEPVQWVPIAAVAAVVLAGAAAFVLWKKGKLDFLKKGKKEAESPEAEEANVEGE